MEQFYCWYCQSNTNTTHTHTHKHKSNHTRQATDYQLQKRQ